MNEKTPITLLCGYLGAGKTTLLNQILNNQKGYKVAVIVNDIGEVNVDASLIAKGGNITDTSDIVPLTNGCICCTLKSQMAKNIEKMIGSGKYDYIMIEASGVCEPMPIAQELELVKNGKLDNVVGVVDASRLVDEFAGGDSLLRKEQIKEEDIESLLIQQIEFCSTLVINKKDLVTEDQFRRVRKVIEALHPGVKIIETDHGKVDVTDILSTSSFDFEKVYTSAGWCKALEEAENDDDDDDELDGHHHVHREEDSDEDEYGIGTFIYTRRRPFNRSSLRKFVKNWPQNIIRSKGVCWFSDEPDMAYLFETSGRQLYCTPYGKWIACAPSAEQKKIIAANPGVLKDWDPEVGDRIIRLCVIGRDMNKNTLEEALDQIIGATCKTNFNKSGVEVL